MNSEFWDVARDEGDASFADSSYAFANGAEWGAGWLAAVIGLGLAIQERERAKYHAEVRSLRGALGRAVR